MVASVIYYIYCQESLVNSGHGSEMPVASYAPLH